MDYSLIGRLHDLRDRFMDEWGLTVQVDSSGLHALVPAALPAEVCRLVHEALANAARHGETSFARVEVAATDEDVFLSVQDSGVASRSRGATTCRGSVPSGLVRRVSSTAWRIWAASRYSSRPRPVRGSTS